jgi:signal transduction histidine kinase
MAEILLLLIALVLGIAGVGTGVAAYRLWVRTAPPALAVPPPQDPYRYLTYNLAHDISNPLQSILVTLENISACSVQDEARWRQYLALLRNDIRYLAKLTDEAKLLAQLDAPDLPLVQERVNLDRVAVETIFSLGERADQRGVRLAYQGLPQPPWVWGDNGKLRQLLYNLIENGIKYVPDGTGEVVVIVRADTLGLLTLTVADNGSGMSPDHLQSLWDAPFQPRNARTRQQAGTGLGLVIVKRIVEQHRGTIAVASMEGKGTTFTVSLPIYSPESAPAPLLPSGSVATG